MDSAPQGPQGRKRSATATSLAEEPAPINKRLVAVGAGECPSLQVIFNLLTLSEQNLARVLSEPTVQVLMGLETQPPLSALSKHIRLATLRLGKLTRHGQMMQMSSTDLLGNRSLHLAPRRRCIRYFGLHSCITKYTTY